MALEIERKFLVSEAPGWLADYPSDEIQQGYLALDGETEVRIRHHGDARTLTVKSGGGLVRVEVETEIDADRFEALWPLTDGRRVSKRRFRLTTEHLHFDVDVYDGDLEGLAVAEVEFGSVAESEGFDPQPWLGAEVTEDDRYKNRSLALHGVPG